MRLGAQHQIFQSRASDQPSRRRRRLQLCRYRGQPQCRRWPERSTADVARLHGTNPSPRSAAILAISKSRLGSPYNSQYLRMQAPRASTASTGLAYSCISSSNPEPSPPDLPSVLFSRETRPCGGEALNQRCSYRVTAHGTGLAETSRGSHTNGQGLDRASRQFVTSSL